MSVDIMNPPPDREVVWLTYSRKFAWLVHRGAYFSVVSWFEDEVEYEDTVDNDDYEFWQEHAIEFATDAD